jgi:hypothetical protein
VAARATAIRMVLSAILLCFLTTSCGLTRQSMDIDYNNQRLNDSTTQRLNDSTTQRLNDGLESLLHQQKSGRLSDFTAWNWDEVHLFHEHTDREFIEETVGAPVIRGDYYDSKASLLVFEDDGTPVKAVGISGEYLRADGHRVSWPADVMLEPLGTGALQLTLPRG